MQYRAITLAAWALTCSGAALAGPNPNEPATADDPASQPQQSQTSQWPQQMEPQERERSSYQRSAGDQSAHEQASSVDTAQQTTGQAAEPRLVSAEELVGKSVITRDGESAGTVKYITIDLAAGAVSHLIVDTAGTSFAEPGAATGRAGDTATGAEQATEHEQDAIAGTQTDHDAVQRQGSVAATGQQGPGTQGTGAARPGQSSDTADQTASADSLVILPWTVVEVNEQTRRIETSASAQQFSQAPRLASQDLNQLTEPALMAYVVDYWAPASELAAFESQRRQQEQSDDTGSSDESTTSYETTPYRDQNDASSEPPETDPQRDQAGIRQPQTETDTAWGSDTRSHSSDTARSGETPRSDMAGRSADPSGQASTAQSTPPAQQSGEQPLQAGEQQTMVLLGQSAVAQVMPPMFHLGKDLKGAAVRDRNGQQVGEIRRIVIDQQSGRAAYAVVENRSSGEPAPVPLTALEWSSEGTTTLTADAGSLEADRTLTENPDQARRADLAQLYQRFDAEPYWNTGSDRGSRPQLEP